MIHCDTPVSKVAMTSVIVSVPFLILLLITYVIIIQSPEATESPKRSFSPQQQKQKRNCSPIPVGALIERIYPDSDQYRFLCTVLNLGENIVMVLTECFANKPIYGKHYVTSGSLIWSNTDEIYDIVNYTEVVTNNQSILVLDLDPELPSPCNNENFIVENGYKTNKPHYLIGWNVASLEASKTIQLLLIENRCLPNMTSALVYTHQGFFTGFQTVNCKSSSPIETSVVVLANFLEDLEATIENITVSKQQIYEKHKNDKQLYMVKRDLTRKKINKPLDTSLENMRMSVNRIEAATNFDFVQIDRMLRNAMKPTTNPDIKAYREFLKQLYKNLFTNATTQKPIQNNRHRLEESKTSKKRMIENESEYQIEKFVESIENIPIDKYATSTIDYLYTMDEIINNMLRTTTSTTVTTTTEHFGKADDIIKVFLKNGKTVFEPTSTSYPFNTRKKYNFNTNATTVTSTRTIVTGSNKPLFWNSLINIFKYDLIKEDTTEMEKNWQNTEATTTTKLKKISNVRNNVIKGKITHRPRRNRTTKRKFLIKKLTHHRNSSGVINRHQVTTAVYKSSKITDIDWKKFVTIKINKVTDVTAKNNVTKVKGGKQKSKVTHRPQRKRTTKRKILIDKIVTRKINKSKKLTHHRNSHQVTTAVYKSTNKITDIDWKKFVTIKINKVTDVIDQKAPTEKIIATISGKKKTKKNTRKTKIEDKKINTTRGKTTKKSQRRNVSKRIKNSAKDTKTTVAATAKNERKINNISKYRKTTKHSKRRKIPGNNHKTTAVKRTRHSKRTKIQLTPTHGKYRKENKRDLSNYISPLIERTTVTPTGNYKFTKPINPPNVSFIGVLITRAPAKQVKLADVADININKENSKFVNIFNYKNLSFVTETGDGSKGSNAGERFNNETGTITTMLKDIFANKGKENDDNSIAISKILKLLNKKFVVKSLPVASCLYKNFSIEN